MKPWLKPCRLFRYSGESNHSVEFLNSGGTWISIHGIIHLILNQYFQVHSISHFLIGFPKKSTLCQLVVSHKDDPNPTSKNSRSEWRFQRVTPPAKNKFATLRGPGFQPPPQPKNSRDRPKDKTKRDKQLTNTPTHPPTPPPPKKEKETLQSSPQNASGRFFWRFARGLARFCSPPERPLPKPKPKPNRSAPPPG